MREGPRELQNLRDVGGLPAARGTVRPAVVYRSDAPQNGDVPPGGLVWPPATVIDLRSDSERGGPHPLACADTEVLFMPLASQASLEEIVKEIPDGLAHIYLQILVGCGDLVVRAVQTIAEAPGPVLVHCAAGKDRTGTLIAILLAALEVPRARILGDYLATEAHMPGVLARQIADPTTNVTAKDIETIRVERPELIGVSESAMDAVLVHLDEAGGAATWLVDQGLEPSVLETLRRRLIDFDGPAPG